jgi:hypothetical protein
LQVGGDTVAGTQRARREPDDRDGPSLLKKFCDAIGVALTHEAIVLEEQRIG